MLMCKCIIIVMGVAARVYVCVCVCVIIYLFIHIHCNRFIYVNICFLSFLDKFTSIYISKHIQRENAKKKRRKNRRKMKTSSICPCLWQLLDVSYNNKSEHFMLLNKSDRKKQNFIHMHTQTRDNALNRLLCYCSIVQGFIYICM